MKFKVWREVAEQLQEANDKIYQRCMVALVEYADSSWYLIFGDAACEMLHDPFNRVGVGCLPGERKTCDYERLAQCLVQQIREQSEYQERHDRE